MQQAVHLEGRRVRPPNHLLPMISPSSVVFVFFPTRLTLLLPAGRNTYVRGKSLGHLYVVTCSRARYAKQTHARSRFEKHACVMRDWSAPTARTGTRCCCCCRLFRCIMHATHAHAGTPSVSCQREDPRCVSVAGRPVSFDLSNEKKKEYPACMVSRHTYRTRWMQMQAHARTRHVQRWQAAGVYPGDEIPGFTIPPYYVRRS